MRRIAILGSTGSIGVNSLDVVSHHPDQLKVAALTAGNRWRELAAQCQVHRPALAVICDESIRAEVDPSLFPAQTELIFGPNGLAYVASQGDIDTVVCGVVGAAGLRGSWAAIEAGHRLALANKETLVIAGPLAMSRAAETGSEILPVDSEHSAIFQCLQAGRQHDVRRIVLTASGGPFRGWSRDQMATVTAEQALAHPTWKMGKKISIDSATMMNKALEIIEARWLFGLHSSQIGVVVHPQSIAHSFVEFIDGSVIGQLSPPDMRLPIQYALSYPERWKASAKPMPWGAPIPLNFEPADPETFPALKLGFEVADRGGTCGAVLNAANEVAVERFLRNEIGFLDIVTSCRDVLSSHQFEERPTLARLLEVDDWARKEMWKWK